MLQLKVQELSAVGLHGDCLWVAEQQSMSWYPLEPRVELVLMDLSLVELVDLSLVDL